jgi:hypothetical protein
MNSQTRPKPIEPNTPITLKPKAPADVNDNDKKDPDISHERDYLIEDKEVTSVPTPPPSVPDNGLFKELNENSPPEPDDEHIPDNDHMESYEDASYALPPTAPPEEPHRKLPEKTVPEPKEKSLAQPVEKPLEDVLSSGAGDAYSPTDPRPLPVTPTEIPPGPPPPPEEAPEPPKEGNGSTDSAAHPEGDKEEAEEMTEEKDEEEKDPGKPAPPKKTSKKKKEKNTLPQRKTAFWLFTPIILMVIFIVYLSFAVPGVMSFIGSAFYALTFGTFFLFIMLGVFVVFGFREQAKTLLQIVFEGGVKYIDIAQFFSDLWDEVIRLVQDFVLFISPAIAIMLSMIFYYVVMYVFRYMATLGDVTVFTVIMTIVLASITAGLSLGDFGQGEEDSYSFRSQFAFRFGRVFVDSIEIVVAIIFLTIDLPKPFFLPESLHGEVRAEALGIDLMERGIAPDGFATTLRIAGLGVLIEIIRKIYRIGASMVIRYKQLKKQVEEQDGSIETADDMFELLRRASRIAFKDNLDDLTKFLGFTTVLVAVFFFFPRLKLLSLLVFNASNLVWDIIFPKRTVKPPRSEDLFSRLIAKAFKL